MSITIVLVLITCVISYLGFSNVEFFNKYKHQPYAEKHNNEWWRLLTSGFLHADWMHLLVNMFVFYQFGSIVENEFDYLFGTPMSKIYFTAIYLTTIVMSSLPSYYKHQNDGYYSAIGASGGTSGIVFIYILFYPWNLLYFYGIIPIPGIVGGIAYLIYSSWASRHSNDNIGHDAHFYGAIFGVLLTILIKPMIFQQFIQELMSFNF
ncbi:MAG: rhomboid family intramembrane serine protease [Saprospiraceae bacterium]|nr:rhomboid family intramembrane serine protease [Saprospiraceae bacterium]